MSDENDPIWAGESAMTILKQDGVCPNARLIEGNQHLEPCIVIPKKDFPGLLKKLDLGPLGANVPTPDAPGSRTGLKVMASAQDHGAGVPRAAPKESAPHLG